MTDVNILLSRAVDEALDKEHLAAALRSGKKLRVKLGIDPTAPDLHLGNAVVLRKLRQFQELGHKVVLIIGDFTAMIGDPSGRSEGRKSLGAEEVKKNMKKYLEQAGKIIDIKKTEVHYNSKWLKKPNLIPEIASKVSVQQVLEREDFQKRIREGAAITVLEEIYPLLQGYDSVAVKADVEVGGTDQKFNLLMGRRMQRAYGMAEQDIMTLVLLEGTDGVRKMSKSFGNYVALTEKPNEMFGKIMSVPDALLGKYYSCLTDSDIPKDISPRDAKLQLAKKIVAVLHGAAKAEKAEKEFVSVFSRKELPSDMPEKKLNRNHLPLIDLLLEADIVSSRSEARRLILQGGIKINQKTKNDPAELVRIENGDVLKAGKRKFLRLTIG